MCVHRWFSLSSLRKVIKRYLMDSHLLCAHSILPVSYVCDDSLPITITTHLQSPSCVSACCTVLSSPVFVQDGSLDKCMPHSMRMEFIQTLCMAEQLQILHSIQHIASNAHRKMLRVAQTSSHQPMPPEILQKCTIREEDGGNEGSLSTGQLSLSFLDTSRSDEERGEEETCGDVTGSSSHAHTLSQEDSGGVEVAGAGGEVGSGYCNSSDDTAAQKCLLSNSHCERRNCRYMSYGIGVGRLLI